MTKTKTNIIDKIADVLTPIAAKMQEFHLVSALASTMQALMPITIIGSFACLGAFLDIGGYQAFLAEYSINLYEYSIINTEYVCFIYFVNFTLFICSKIRYETSISNGSNGSCCLFINYATHFIYRCTNRMVRT